MCLKSVSETKHADYRKLGHNIKKRPQQKYKQLVITNFLSSTCRKHRETHLTPYQLGFLKLCDTEFKALLRLLTVHFFARVNNLYSCNVKPESEPFVTEKRFI